MRRHVAVSSVSTEGLLNQLLSLLMDTNNILGAIDDIEMEIHEANAEGEPVSTGANEVISLLDNVRGDFERARSTLIDRLDVLEGKKTPAPVEEPEEEFIEEEEAVEPEDLEE